MSEVTSAPMDQTLAERFVTRVSWADRFLATVRGKRGFNRVQIYSVQELLTLSSGGAVVISGPALAVWFDDVVGDSELASAIREASAGLPLFEEAQAVLPLVAARHAEAVAMAGGAAK